jgi:hypothetical protein
MTFAAATSSLPIATGLVVALACFGAWAVLVAGPWGRSGSAHASDAAQPAAGPSAMPAGVSAVVGPHYRIAAPDDDAVAAAMALRVPPAPPHLRLVVDRDRAVPDDVQRSA